MAITHMEPGVLRILAPNPGPLTGAGTNSYLIGTSDLCLIDPGPNDARHRDALLQAIAGRVVRAIVLSHAHRDHTGLAPGLSGLTGAPVLAFGRPADGRRPFIAGLVALGVLPNTSGEGVHDIAPDWRLSDGQVLRGTDWDLQILHTPGHMANHIALRCRDALFVGDTVLGSGTTVIAPPDGDMVAYMDTLRRLAAAGLRRIYPGHGEPVDDPERALAALLAHRRARAAEIRAHLTRGQASIAALRALIYPDLDPALWPAAQMNVRAHLLEMLEVGTAASVGPLPGATHFRLA